MSRNQPRRFRQVFSRDLREFAESEFLGSITTSPFGVAIEFLYQFAEGLEVLRSSQEFSGVLRSSQEFSGVAPADRPSFSFESSTRGGNPPTRGRNTCSYEPPLIGVLKRTSQNLA